MKKTEFAAKAAATAAMAATLASLAFAQPAAAAQVNSSYGNTQAAIDNSPGNGAAGWVWVYTIATRGSIEYQLWGDSTTWELVVPYGKSASRSTPSDVRGFRPCRWSIFEGVEYKSCGNWTYFG